ncbi:type II toxin-antitoxin system RelE/ParE family toxin [Arcticibacterium luteifluviistationis]|uniref:Plasmid stabilization protein n=1 Tax=Arcticibacterium luteifluviistationis TaxID=1784714 RepID=A0A2Z4GII2_9BACT|nr:hypothetical protein [Arcticibacterium luteifluviistationis]AWW00664.1 hypothetical protein DJ013_21740 [Arcticibacterium luteifluviistationis]
MKSYEIEISPFVSTKILHLLDFLESEWGEISKVNFLKSLNDALLKIKSFPKSSPLYSKRLKIHQCVVSKRTTIFYRISGSTVQVLALTDNRQNPKMIHEELIALFNKQ